MQPSFIKIGGELVGMDALLASVELVQELNQHSWCSVEWRNSPDRRLRVEESLGAPMQVTTRDQSGVEHVIFEGFVLDGRLEYEISGSYRARLLGVTRSYLLDVTPQEAYFRKATLTDVASRLTAEDGLTAAVTCPALPPKNYVQWGQTDFAFLVRLADDYGAWVRPAPQGIEISNEFDKGPDLTWRDDEGLLGFRVAARVAQPAFGGAHYNARLMRSAVLDRVQKRPEFFGPSGPLLAAALRESAKLPQGYLWTDTRAATEKEYRDALERESLRVAASAVTACGHSRNETIRPGHAVSVAGYIETAGKWGVTKVVHNWTPEGYGNEFWCTSSKTWLPAERPSAKWMDGAVVARVVDHNDPRGMGRVKIQYDWLGDGATGWVRMLTPYAGADRGFMFMPEIGDEVLAMFEHGDPERPYVIGGLWNGVDRAPREDFWGGDMAANDIKRIVTKSGHRIQLSDKSGKEAITFATPSKLKLGMYEKADETGRPMIAVHSDGDVFVSAPNGRVHLQAKFVSREVGTSGTMASGGAVKAAAAGVSVATAAPAKPAPTERKQPPVPPKKKSTTWIELQYLYPDGKGVPRASYTVKKIDGSVVSSGALDNNGFVRVDGLDADIGPVTYTFFDDPVPYAPNPDWQPKISSGTLPPDHYIDLAGVTGAIGGGFEWVWGALKGDFNEDPSVGQIALNTVVTMIPVVDQVGDVRDLTADLKALIWDKRTGEAAVWLGVFLTLFGCIPEIGSVGKGVLKALKKADAKTLMHMMNSAGRGNAFRWLKKLAAELPEHARGCAGKFKKILEGIAERLKQLKKYVPESFRKDVEELIQSAESAAKKVDGEFEKVEKELKGELEEKLSKLEKEEHAGSTGTKNTAKQDREPLSRAVETESRRSGRSIGEAGKEWEDALRRKTRGESKIVGGREIDSVTETELIQAKDIAPGTKPKNFLNKKTRAQIKQTIALAQEQGKKAVFWFRSEPDLAIVKYITDRGGVVRIGLE